MRYTIAMWLVDERPEGERNQSGIRKLRRELTVEGTVTDAVEKAAEALSHGTKDQRAKVARVRIEAETPVQETGDLNIFGQGSEDD